MRTGTVWARNDVVWSIDEYIRACSDYDKSGKPLNKDRSNKETLGMLVQERNRVASFLGTSKKGLKQILQERANG